jgi:hypothetical protein
LILLDENSLRSQREFLEARRLPVRKVGLDWGRPGMTDGEILTELRGARQVTFFTRDADFYRRSLCHPAYCLVVIAASAEQLASYATRLLRHRSFRTHALRMAKVLRLQPSRILCWVRNSNVVSFR